MCLCYVLYAQLLFDLQEVHVFAGSGYSGYSALFWIFCSPHTDSKALVASAYCPAVVVPLALHTSIASPAAHVVNFLMLTLEPIELLVLYMGGCGLVYLIPIQPTSHHIYMYMWFEQKWIQSALKSDSLSMHIICENAL